MILKVEQNDIDCGVKENPSQCPVARAFKGAGFHNVTVYENHVNFEDSYSNNTNILENFIRDFDSGVPVMPHNFRINIA